MISTSAKTLCPNKDTFIGGGGGGGGRGRTSIYLWGTTVPTVGGKADRKVSTCVSPGGDRVQGPGFLWDGSLGRWVAVKYGVGASCLIAAAQRRWARVWPGQRELAGRERG